MLPRVASPPPPTAPRLPRTRRSPSPARRARATGAGTLLRLTAGSVCTERATLARGRSARGRRAASPLAPGRAPGRLAAARSSRPRRGRRSPSASSRTASPRRRETPDPLQADEWWLAQIGVEGQTAPGPGVPVTIVDSGLDFTHPEFAGRADTVALNAQEPAPLGGEHGTSVASVIGAPLNGVGLVGIYPRAVLRSWDAAKGSGTRLESSEIAGGILAAARAGKSVINLSLGADTRDLSIELAVSEAVATGSLVVAASGNDGDRGSPIGYPAALAARDDRRRHRSLGRGGRLLEPLVVRRPRGARRRHRRRERARQELAPLVRHELLVPARRRRCGLGLDSPSGAHRRPGGRDPPPLRARPRGAGTRLRRRASGCSTSAAALALATPIRDPYEPNDDVDEVDPNGDRYLSKAPALTTSSRLAARISGRLDAYEDPRDVFRVWLPARTERDRDAPVRHGRQPRALLRRRDLRHAVASRRVDS